MIIATANIYSADDVHFTVDTDEFIHALGCLSPNDDMTDALNETFQAPGYVADWRAADQVAIQFLGDSATKVRDGWSGNVENMLTDEFTWAVYANSDGRHIAFTGGSPIGNVSYSHVWDLTGETDDLEFPATVGRFECTADHAGQVSGGGGRFDPEMSSGRTDAIARNYDPEWVDMSWAYVECPVPGCYHQVSVGVDTE